MSEQRNRRPDLRVVDQTAEQHRRQLAELHAEAVALAAEVARVVRILATSEARNG